MTSFDTGKRLVHGGADPRLSLAPPAFHGLAGSIVWTIEPHSEADPAALLMTFLAAFGALVGPGPHAVADGAKHGAHLSVLIVGDTAKARKGSSWAQVRRLLDAADREFMTERVLSGFGSGEALVDAVAPQAIDGALDVPADGRLLAVEPEFRSVLSVCKREGSTLSSILRQSWDGGRLQARSRARTAVADDTHVSVLGHITSHELRAGLAESDAYGGLLNRFLIVEAHRSKLLPDGGNLDDSVIAHLGSVIASVAERARQIGVLRRTAEATKRWSEIYSELARDEPGGLLGSVIARDSAQVLRLSVTYALLDGCGLINVAHLEAALAVWHYCRASAAHVFGELTGDNIADGILAALRKAGSRELSRTEVRDIFGRHVRADRIDQAVGLLVHLGLATEATEATEGRPRTVLRLAAKTTEGIDDGTSHALPSPRSLSSHSGQAQPHHADRWDAYDDDRSA